MRYFRVFMAEGEELGSNILQVAQSRSAHYREGRRSRLLGRTYILCHCKPSKELTCELRKRIVARAHDHDAIAGTGQPDQQVAAGGAIRKSKGRSPTLLDCANDIVAADAAVDRAAEVNRLGHDQN